MNQIAFSSFAAFETGPASVKRLPSAASSASSKDCFQGRHQEAGSKFVLRSDSADFALARRLAIIDRSGRGGCTRGFASSPGRRQRVSCRFWEITLGNQSRATLLEWLQLATLRRADEVHLYRERTCSFYRIYKVFPGQNTCTFKFYSCCRANCSF